MPDLVLSAADASDSLALTDTASPVYLTAGTKGLSLPPTSVIADANPYLPGSLVRAVRDESREVFLPLLLDATTQADLWAARSRLFAILRPSNPLTGCLLTATDPATGTDRSLVVVYAGGAEGDLSSDQYGRTWQRYGILLRAADPYWFSAQDESVTWSGSGSTTWFPFFPLELSSSQILSGSTVAGTTNLWVNPSVEININGWGNFSNPTDPTLSQDSTRSRFGSSSVRYDWPTAVSGGTGGVTVTGLTIGVQYTASAWVYNQTGMPAVQIAVFFIGSGTSTTVHDSWERLSVTFTATATDHFMYVVSTGAVVLGQSTWVDGWQCELGAAATAYCDGDQAGCVWNGVAHNSTSTRSAAFEGTELEVIGDAQTWPRWNIVGPGSALTLVHYGQDKRLDLVGDIPDGNTVTIDTRPRQQAIYDSDGNNLMGRLQTGFSLFPLDPGRNDISIALTGTTSSSAVGLTYTPRWLAE